MSSSSSGKPAPKRKERDTDTPTTPTDVKKHKPSESSMTASAASAASSPSSPSSNKHGWSKLSAEEAAELAQRKASVRDFTRAGGKKRKTAVLFGYNGARYSGLQVNPDVDTVEDVLREAFLRAGCLSGMNADKLQKVNWTRAARTDKGVHAACNAVAFKMLIYEDESDDPYADAVKRINAHLPAHVRVWDAVRVSKNFRAHSMCSSRHYEYVLPTFAFMPSEEYHEWYQANCSSGVSVDDADAAPSSSSSAEAAAKAAAIAASGDDDEGDDEPARTHVHGPPGPSSFRISAEQLARLNELLGAYVGTKPYHNFTREKTHDDRSAMRFIMEFGVKKVWVHEASGIEFALLHVHGQSFMIHQIRKMVGMVVALMRGTTFAGLDGVAGLEEMFGPTKRALPMAPALGLYLDRLVYKSYDEHMGRAASRDSTMPARPTLGGTMTAHYDEIEAFKEKNITDYICGQEVKQQSLKAWINVAMRSNSAGIPVAEIERFSASRSSSKNSDKQQA